MSTQHPITPPPELVQQWADMLSSRSDQAVFAMAAQWGADQELEACVSYVDNNISGYKARALRAVRRPQPPSVKEQLLQKLEQIRDVADKYQNTQDAIDDLRVTLEALPND
jgi:hypothetical protein